jgi:hypothetical protein
METYYVVIAAFLDADPGDYFAALDDSGEQWFCIEDPEIIVAKVTIEEYLGTYFEEVVLLTALKKIESIAKKDFDFEPWTVAVDDYFTTYANKLDLYKVVSDEGLDWGYRLISGDTFDSSVQTDTKEGFGSSRIWVDFSSDDEGSGSGSGS